MTCEDKWLEKKPHPNGNWARVKPIGGLKNLLTSYSLKSKKLMNMLEIGMLLVDFKEYMHLFVGSTYSNISQW